MDSEARRRFATLAVGLTFFWQFLRYRNLGQIFGESISTQIPVSPFFIQLVAVVAVGSIIFVALFSRIYFLFKTRVILLVGALGSLATLALISFDFGGTAFFVARAACTAILGVCFVGVLFWWVHLLSAEMRHDWRNTVVCVAVSPLLTLALSTIASLGQIPAAIIQTSAFFVNGLVLFFCSRNRLDKAGNCRVRAAKDSMSTDVKIDFVASQSKGTMRGIVILTFVLMLLSSLAKGRVGNGPTDFMTNPVLSYSHLATLVLGICIILAIVSGWSIGRIGLTAVFAISLTLALGFFLIGQIGPDGFLVGSALVVTTRSIAETILFVVTVLLFSSSCNPATLFLFIGSEVVSALVGHLAVPMAAMFCSTDIEGLTVSMALLYSIVALLACSLTLIGPATRAVDSSMGLPKNDDDVCVSAEPSRIDRFCSEHSLTPKETTVLRWLLQGYNLPDIARRENLSESTVRTHYRNIYAKLDVHSKTELIDLFQRYRDLDMGKTDQ